MIAAKSVFIIFHNNRIYVELFKRISIIIHFHTSCSPRARTHVWERHVDSAQRLVKMPTLHSLPAVAAAVAHRHWWRHPAGRESNCASRRQRLLRRHPIAGRAIAILYIISRSFFLLLRPAETARIAECLRPFRALPPFRRIQRAAIRAHVLVGDLELLLLLL